MPVGSGVSVSGVHVVLVTGNPHKVDELAAALPAWHVDGLQLEREPHESGDVYAANARIKALAGRAGAPATAWVVGEDSGIEARALDGAPGIRSARWDDDGVARMLRELDGADDRRARYVCSIVALGPAGEEVSVEGVLEGVVADEASGDEGFGYDPIFVPLGQTRTVAELGDAWKARNSHRARAAAALAEALTARVG
jgi:XTP/dITP diphosphohydrolase